MSRHAVQELDSFAAEKTFSDIPEDVIERAHWVLRDTVGVNIGGMNELLTKFDILTAYVYTSEERDHLWQQLGMYHS